MRQLPIIFLLLSSFFCLLFSSCKISKYNKFKYREAILSKEVMAPVLKDTRSIKFKTTIDVLSNHLSGILVVKQTDSITKHMVFVTELGMKMFDFEMKNDAINAKYVFEPLNKPALVSALQNNFKNMLLLDVFNKESLASTNRTKTMVYKQTTQKAHRFFVIEAGGTISSQEVFNKKKRSAKYSYEFDNDLKIYSKIIGKQYGLIKFYFELNYIPNTND